MPKLNPNTLKKLNLYKTNPDLVKDVSANELADLVIVLLNSINFVENSIASGQADISGAMTKQVNALFTEYKTDSQNIKAELKSAISGSKQQIKEDGDNAKSELKEALRRLNERVSALTNGDNGVVTEAEVQRAAQMALGMLELPDFAEMVSTSIQSDGEAIRNALELLVGEERYAVEIVDVKGLEDRLKQLAVTSQGSPGGTSKPAVYRFIRDAIADGIIGGGSSLPDQSGNNGKFLSTDGTDASWETVSAGTVDVVSNVATDRILGRTTAGTGDSEQLTASEVRTLINVADGATANTGALADLDTVDTAQIDDDAITNAKIAGAGTRDATTFYRGDGTFAAPSGSGDLVGPSSAADNSVPTYDGTTGKLVQDQGSMFIDDDGNVGIGTASPASPLTIANAATNKAQFGTGTVNSSIKISNRMEVGYNGKGYINTPVVKNMEIRTNSIVKQIVHTTGILTSGTNYGVQFTPTVNQASGTAGFTALHVDVTETATGSGSQLLMDLQVGGSSKFVVDNAGNVGIGTTAPDTKLQVAGAITQQPLSSDPADPDAGNSVQWVSDGTGTGDAGDVLLKVNVGGTTKVITLIDYSVA